MGLLSDATWVDRQSRKELRKFIKQNAMVDKNSRSIIAFNGKEEIMGIKLGFFISREDKKKPFQHNSWQKSFYWMMPQRMVDWNIAMFNFEHTLRSHPSFIMEDLEVDKFFSGEVLGVAKEMRGLGMGKELLRMSMDLAREAGCQAYFSCVSGIYSSKIYEDMKFTFLRESLYADVKDQKGRIIMNDTREHTKSQTCYFKF